MNTLDRFASPLSSEGFTLSLEILDEQNQLNKRDIVNNFISSYLTNTNTFPDAEMIQETFYKIDLDSSLIESELKEAKRSWK